MSTHGERMQARSARFHGPAGPTISEETFESEGGAVLVAVRARLWHKRVRAEVALVDDGVGRVIERVALSRMEEDHVLELYSFSAPPSGRTFTVRLSARHSGTATGYMTVVHPVTASAVEALRITSPLAAPPIRPDPPALPPRRQLAPLVALAAGEDVCDAQDGGAIVAIYHRGRSAMTEVIGGVVPANNSHMCAVGR